ncbi:MAG: VWA domain-containing protein [Planctomycetota bacterium]
MKKLWSLVALTLVLAAPLLPAPLLAAPLPKGEEKKIKQALGEAITKGDWDAAGKQLKALAAADDKKAWQLMVKVVEKSPPEAQLELILADAAKTMTNAGVQAEVRKTAVKSSQARIRRVLIGSLAEVKDWDGLAKALKDKDEQVAAMAAWALIDARAPEGVEPLLERLEQLEKNRDGIWDVLNKGLGQLLGLRCSSAIEYRSRWELVKSQGGLDSVKPEPQAEGEGEVKTMVRVRLFGRAIDCTRVVFILDVSGSMKEKDPDQLPDDSDEAGTRTRKGAGDSAQREGGDEANLLTRLERAQRQLKKVIANLPANFKINIVAYSSQVKLWRGPDVDHGKQQPELHPLSDANRKEAIAFVESFKASGVTVTDTALRRAYEVDGARCFYLLSDGTATHDGQTPVPTPEIISVLDEFKAKHVTVHTLGFKDADVEMMKELAKHTGGRYSDIK